MVPAPLGWSGRGPSGSAPVGPASTRGPSPTRSCSRSPRELRTVPGAAAGLSPRKRSQPAAFSALTWAPAFWSSVLTLAYPRCILWIVFLWNQLQNYIAQSQDNAVGFCRTQNPYEAGRGKRAAKPIVYGTRFRNAPTRACYEPGWRVVLRSCIVTRCGGRGRYLPSLPGARLGVVP